LAEHMCVCVWVYICVRAFVPCTVFFVGLTTDHTSNTGDWVLPPPQHKTTYIEKKNKLSHTKTGTIAGQNKKSLFTFGNVEACVVKGCVLTIVFARIESSGGQNEKPSLIRKCRGMYGQGLCAHYSFRAHRILGKAFSLSET